MTCLQYSKVLPSVLPSMWPMLRPVVASALQDTMITTPEYVYDRLMVHDMTLWICHDKNNHDDAHSIAITQFVRHDTGLFMTVFGCAVIDDKSYDFDYMFEFLEAYAKSANCRGYEIIGRVGWQRKLPQMKMEGVVLRATFDAK